MNYERKRHGEKKWLPIIGNGRVAWIKECRPDLYKEMCEGKEVNDPWFLPGSIKYRATPRPEGKEGG